MSEMPERIWAYPDTRYSYNHTVFTEREPVHHTTKISYIRADIHEAKVAALQAELDTTRKALEIAVTFISPPIMEVLKNRSTCELAAYLKAKDAEPQG